MATDWKILAVTIVYGLVGGWLAARLTRTFAQRHIALPVMIAACALVAAWALLVVYGMTAIALSLCLGFALVVLAATDMLAFRLPDALTFPLIAAGFVAAELLPAEQLWKHVTGAAIGFLALWAVGWLFHRLRGREGLGLGDAKLAAAAGAWLGLEPFPSVLLIASVMGILWFGVIALLRGRAALGERLAFGVPLCFAIWLVWLYGPLTFASGGS